MQSAPLKLLVTGANGFVGRALCVEAVAQGMLVCGSMRHQSDLPAGIERVVVGEIDEKINWQRALNGCDVVIHLAARVHVMRESEKIHWRSFVE